MADTTDMEKRGYRKLSDSQPDQPIEAMEITSLREAQGARVI